uniref:Trafficking protein particle complex subunit n=1 Tax=Rhizochromulina marina TaxID=1034831 RepID=A0A7S2RBL8_9STRA
MIYNLYIFNRKGVCLYYREWKRPFNSFPPDDQDEERKLVFGMLFSIKEMVSRMTPRTADAGLSSIQTGNFTLHHLETVTGFRFVLNTDTATTDLRQNLQHIYSEIFVEYVLKNPLFDPMTSTSIEIPLFDSNLSEYIQLLSCFRSGAVVSGR